MPEQQVQQNKNPVSTAWRAADQNFLGGMGPGGAQPFYQQGINQFNQGRDISQQNGGGGLRQTGRGLVNVIDGNLLGGMIPGGVKPSEVFMGTPTQGKNPQQSQSQPQQPPQQSQNPGLYNRLDSMMGNRLPGGNQAQGKNPQPTQSFGAPGQMPGPVQLPNPGGNTGIDRLDTGITPPRGNQPTPVAQPNKNPSGSNSPMTDAIMGSPMPNRFNSPLAGMFEAYQPITASGGAFQAAVDAARRAQRPNPNIMR